MASSIADQNLLFGVLALQMQFVSQEQIVAALDAWGHAKDKSLGDILVQQNVLDANRRQLLDAVLAQRLQQHGGNAAHSLAALAVPPALHEQLTRIVDADVQASVARIPAPLPPADPYATNYGVPGVKTQPEIALPADPFPTNVGGTVGATQPEPAKSADPYATNLPSVGGAGGITRTDEKSTSATMGGGARSTSGHVPSGTRFRVLKPHARGGLGEVLIAQDEEIHRDVALKQIQAPHADDEDSRSRFVFEGEITGQLEHPGIVPVYGLGQYADGRPYYAMRFISGDSLKEAIDRFHKDDKSDATERNLQLRHLLERFVDVCQAIAYAHSRGVLHRDLKPGNIMLGKYGETLVVDWGLAKPMAEKEKAVEPGQKRITLSGTASATPTLMGAAVGTPQFMSPEQAAGDLDKLGPASDVYSLGATMYALLTGTVPIIERDLITLLARVQKGDFPPPRSIKPGVPKPLEAICLKAMALKPENRYPGPQQLADDIERWLGDEPVQAYPEPWTARLARTLRKNPAIVAASVVAVIGLTILAVVANVMKARETLARQEAERNYKLARSAVDHYHTNVSESVLLNEPGLQPLREKLLQDAERFYKGFVETHREDDPTVQGELARAKYRLGQITGDIRAENKAIEYLKDAAKIFAVDKTVDQAEVARCYHHLGRLSRLTDKFDESVSWYQKALEIWESLPTESEETLAGLARSQFGLGNVLERKRQFDQARTQYDKALTTLAKLTKIDPLRPEFLRDQGVTHRNLGRVYAGMEAKQKDAVGEFQKAIALQEKLVKDNPNLSKFQDDLASSHYTLGDVQFELSQMAEAKKSFEQAARLWATLTNSHPAVLDYHARLADAFALLAEVLLASGNATDAVKVSEQALQVQQTLTEKSKELAKDAIVAPKYRHLLSQRHMTHGDVLRRARMYKAAETAYGDALKIQQLLTADVPKTPEYRADLARTHDGLGLLWYAQKQNNRAEEAFTQALAIWQALQREYPQSAEFALGVSKTLINLRGLMSSPGNHRIALAPLDSILSVYMSPAFNSKEPALQGALFQAHSARAEARGLHAMFAEAIVDWNRAVDLATPKQKAWARLARGVALARYGEAEKATTEAEELAKAATDVPRVLPELARIFALSAKAELSKSGAGADGAKKRADQYAERATELLERAWMLGYFKQREPLQQLALDTDWQALRGRPSFEAFLQKLNPTKPVPQDGK